MVKHFYFWLNFINYMVGFSPMFALFVYITMGFILILILNYFWWSEMNKYDF
nr:ATP synthase F0 subunit 8 [Mactra quadrangularis]